MASPQSLTTRNARLNWAGAAADKLVEQGRRTTDTALRRVLLKAGCDVLDRSLTIDANAESGILYTGRRDRAAAS